MGSIEIVGKEPLIISLGDGQIVGMAMCESDKAKLMEQDGIALIEDDGVVSIAKNETDTDVVDSEVTDVATDAVGTMSACTKDCTPEESVKVLVQTTSDEGKANALNCSIEIEGKEPLIISLGDGQIVGMAMCESDKAKLMEQNGIALIEVDGVVSIANNKADTDEVADVPADVVADAVDIDLQDDASDTPSNNGPKLNNFFLFIGQFSLTALLIL